MFLCIWGLLCITFFNTFSFRKWHRQLNLCYSSNYFFHCHCVSLPLNILKLISSGRIFLQVSSIAMSEPHSELSAGGEPVLPSSSPANLTAKALGLISNNFFFFFFCRYYDQLCSIEPKFPFSENQVRRCIKPLHRSNYNGGN